MPSLMKKKANKMKSIIPALLLAFSLFGCVTGNPTSYLKAIRGEWDLIEVNGQRQTYPYRLQFKGKETVCEFEPDATVNNCSRMKYEFLTHDRVLLSDLVTGEKITWDIIEVRKEIMKVEEKSVILTFERK
jgi:hypothetical protein